MAHGARIASKHDINIRYASSAHLFLLNNTKSYLVGASLRFHIPYSRPQPHQSDHLCAVLADAVELNVLISRSQLLTFAAHTTSPTESSHLTYLIHVLHLHHPSNPHHRPRRLGILHYLHPSPRHIPRHASPIKLRLYSISSSPSLDSHKNNNVNIATLTYDLITNPSQPHHGLASTYLATRTALASVSTHPTPAAPPLTETPPLTTPPPQTRLPRPSPHLSPLGPCLFYYGCRHPSSDYLYAAELAYLEKQDMSIVSVRPTFSRAPESSGGFRYVQERMWAEPGEVRG